RRRRPSSPPFPYTTLFRSSVAHSLDGLLSSTPLRDTGEHVPTLLRTGLRPTVFLTTRFPLSPTGRPVFLAGSYHDVPLPWLRLRDRKSTRLNCSHVNISYA